MGAPDCPTPRKKAYSTEAGAKTHMWALWKKSKQPGKVLNQVYFCRCGKYHVGHAKGARR